MRQQIIIVGLVLLMVVFAPLAIYMGSIYPVEAESGDILVQGGFTCSVITQSYGADFHIYGLDDSEIQSHSNTFSFCSVNGISVSCDSSIVSSDSDGGYTLHVQPRVCSMFDTVKFTTILSEDKIVADSQGCINSITGICAKEYTKGIISISSTGKITTTPFNDGSSAINNGEGSSIINGGGDSGSFLGGKSILQSLINLLKAILKLLWLPFEIIINLLGL